MTNPLLSPDLLQHRINFSAIRPEHFDNAIETLLPQVQAEHEDTVVNAPLQYKALFGSDRANAQLRRVLGLLSHLTSVADNEQLRDVYERKMPEVSRVYQTMGLDERAYQKVKVFTDTSEYRALAPLYKKLVDKVVKDYEEGGIHLPADKKARMTDIGARMTELSHQFDCNLQDFTNEAVLSFSREELSGVPERTLQNATALEDGRLEVSMVAGGFSDIMTYCDVEATRKSVYEYQLARGVAEGTDNRPLLPEILALRAELASTLGYASFADMALDDNMAATPTAAMDFTENLARLALPKAKVEAAEIDAFGEALLGRPLQFWDYGYVAEKYQKERYSVDTEALRAYFPVTQVVSGMFKLLENLYDISFEQDTTQATWHEDVTVWRVIDNATQAVRGSLYMDLFKRKHKDGGAWMNPAINRHVEDGQVRLPVVYLVCNTPKDLGQAPTFTFDDVITLFHEMGHTLHNLLTDVDEEFFSGLANVQHDAVELPSQFMENFCWDYDVLRGLSTHIDTGEALPQEKFDKLYASRLYLAASRMLRTARFALLDMSLHMQDRPDVVALEEQVLSAWSVRQPDTRSRLLPSFSHIFAGGYAAGYYAYQWAEMLSADAFGALREASTSKAEFRSRAMDFRRHILATGGSEDMAVNFERFRGRAPDVKHLLADYGIIDSMESPT